MTDLHKLLGPESSDDEIRIAIKKTKWGKTFLTDILQRADINVCITYLNLPGYFEMLENVADIFKLASETVSYSDLNTLVPLLLLQRACGNYIASVRLSSSGQLPEAYLQLRACIESALYAFDVHNDTKLAKIWLDRHKDRESRKECSKQFKPSGIISKLEQINQSLGKNVKSDYEICIDAGAHPNERSVFTSLSISGKEMTHELLNTKQEGIFRACLLQCVTSGLNAIKIFNMIYPDTFKKFNAEQRMQSVMGQFQLIAHEASYRLRSNYTKKR